MSTAHRTIISWQRRGRTGRILDVSGGKINYLWFDRIHVIWHSCASCQMKLKVKDELAGKKGRCPHCKEVVKIPASADGEPEDDQRDAAGPVLEEIRRQGVQMTEDPR